MFKLIFKQPLWRLIVLAVLISAGFYYVFGRRAVQTSGTVFVAKRGPLQISVLEGGSVEALESQEIRSQIKGFQGTKILNIVEEGYLVNDQDIKNGKILVELDSSDLKQKIITEEIQFQSTLSTLIEATNAYDIQYGQNISDLKAAEQKVRFALMDFQKFVGSSNAQEITDLLALKTPSAMVDFAEAEQAAERLFSSAGGPDLTMMPQAMVDPGLGGPAPMGRGPGGEMPRMANSGPGDGPVSSVAPRPEGMGGDRRGGDQAGAQRPDRTRGDRRRSSTNRPPALDLAGGQMRAHPSAAGPIPLLSGPAPTNNPADFPLAPLTNAVTSAPPIKATPKIARLTNVTIDFSKYADTNKLGDGAAQQSLRKLYDDKMSAELTWGLDKTKLEGTRRLQAKGFATKTELDTDLNREIQDRLRVATAQTALDLFIKYEFVRNAEDFLSKYDEALSLYDRAKKEAISKLAQARARLKSAEGRYGIEVAQRAELYEQYTNCVIRAKRPGLVVYGGSQGDRRFFGNEEPIREGATVRERQSIITIPDMTRMSVKIKVHESHIQKVKKGQKARIQVEAFPDEKLIGEVIKVAVLPDSADRWMNPDMKVYATSVGVEGAREWLKPGMSAKVEILIKELPDVVYIPLQAVFPIKGKQYCFVGKGKNPEQREIEVGEFNDEFIEVRKGLKAGEKVVLRAPEGTESDRIEGEAGTEEDVTGPPGAKPSPAVTTAQPAKGNAARKEPAGGAGPGSARPRPERARGQ